MTADASPGHDHEAGAVIRAGSKSFALASRLFDRETRQRVWDLYAWCRHCDDVIDGQTLGHGRLHRAPETAALAALRASTERAIAGDRDLAAPFAGLAKVVAATALPAVFLRQHLDGFAMDVAARRYDAIDDTLEYCYGVAGVVGLMMAWIMGVRDADPLLRGCDLGLAFQLTNIARDIGDDLDAGRIYLPESWLRDAAVTLVPGHPLTADDARRLRPVVARLLDEADRYYASAWYGMPYLTWRSAWAVATARRVYREIGREVRRRGRRAWETRVSTSRASKVTGLVIGLGEAAWLAAGRGAAGAPDRRGLWVPPHVRNGRSC